MKPSSMEMKSSQELDWHISQFLEANQEAMIEDAKGLIRINSVGLAYNPGSSQPFGEGCSSVLDEAIRLMQREKLDVTDFDGYGVKGELAASERGSIGFFAHLDVVPEGGDWSFPPYEPFVRDGYLFGRGAMDNKAAAVAALYVLKFFADSKLPLGHGLYLFLGCNEENGMRDIRHFLSRHEPPQFGIVPDAYFPLCFAEKGMLRADFEGEVADGNLLAFNGGTEYNVVPAAASAILRDVDPEHARQVLPGSFTVEALPEGIRITASGKAGHAAFPEGTDNAAVKLAAALAAHGLVRGSRTLRALAFVQECFASPYGHGLGIAFRDMSGEATVNAAVRMENGRLRLLCDIRYGVTQEKSGIQQLLEEAAARYGMRLTRTEDSPPHYIAPDDPIAAALCDLANRELGTNQPPYAMGGITHARWLPRAAAFGPLRRDKPSPFPAGRGGGHQPDEAMYLEAIWEAFQIYVKAVLVIDKLLSEEKEQN
ncbi:MULTISPECIES: Sapep family Mn(2+)-dependent dipeptidase [Paenibacillus]|nr:Sapep family Mn(2+)-dependent dipeptidase [Paenibacillus borealis]